MLINPPRVARGRPTFGELSVPTPQSEYTRFEKARIIGARALQVRMGAPILIEMSAGMIDPVEVAMLEYEKELIPLTIHKPK